MMTGIQHPASSPGIPGVTTFGPTPVTASRSWTTPPQATPQPVTPQAPRALTQSETATEPKRRRWRMIVSALAGVIVVAGIWLWSLPLQAPPGWMRKEPQQPGPYRQRQSPSSRATRCCCGCSMRARRRSRCAPYHRGKHAHRPRRAAFCRCHQCERIRLRSARRHGRQSSVPVVSQCQRQQQPDQRQHHVVVAAARVACLCGRTAGRKSGAGAGFAPPARLRARRPAPERTVLGVLADRTTLPR